MSRILELHGTKLNTLTPASIVRAALADLGRVAHKRAGRMEQREPYCFHRAHVRAAKTPGDLISRALDDRDRGIASGKRMTRLVYGDQELLAAALIAARGEKL